MELLVRRLQPQAKLPVYAHPGDAGLDLYAVSTTKVAAHSRTRIATGIAIAIPAGQVGLVWDKSGLAYSIGITTLAGVIDSSYRGEVQVVVYNTTSQPVIVTAGQKIAQLLIQPLTTLVVTEVNALTTTQRADGGFGSTGL